MHIYVYIFFLDMSARASSLVCMLMHINAHLSRHVIGLKSSHMLHLVLTYCDCYHCSNDCFRRRTFGLRDRSSFGLVNRIVLFVHFLPAFVDYLFGLSSKRKRICSLSYINKSSSHSCCELMGSKCHLWMIDILHLYDNIKGQVSPRVWTSPIGSELSWK